MGRLYCLTGITGFVGREAAAQLRRQRCAVRGLALNKQSREATLHGFAVSHAYCTVKHTWTSGHPGAEKVTRMSPACVPARTTARTCPS